MSVSSENEQTEITSSVICIILLQAVSVAMFLALGCVHRKKSNSRKCRSTVPTFGTPVRSGGSTNAAQPPVVKPGGPAKPGEEGKVKKVNAPDLPKVIEAPKKAPQSAIEADEECSKRGGGASADTSNRSADQTSLKSLVADVTQMSNRDANEV